MYYSTSYLSPIGSLTLVSDADKLLALWVEGQKYYGGTIKESIRQEDKLEIFIKTKACLDSYFAGEKEDFSQLPLALYGSDFRIRVWELLSGIPYGETTTYGELAKKTAVKMGKKTMSAQAIGGAVGHNPLSIIIPCHRVVGSNGSLTGYASGLARKIKLLELEGLDTSSFFIPEKGSAL